MKGRAITAAQKRAILDQVLIAWTRYPELRLGQLIECVMASRSGGPDLFNIEDEELVRRLSGWRL